MSQYYIYKICTIIIRCRVNVPFFSLWAIGRTWWLSLAEKRDTDRHYLSNLRIAESKRRAPFRLIRQCRSLRSHKIIRISWFSCQAPELWVSRRGPGKDHSTIASWLIILVTEKEKSKVQTRFSLNLLAFLGRHYLKKNPTCIFRVNTSRYFSRRSTKMYKDCVEFERSSKGSCQKIWILRNDRRRRIYFCSFACRSRRWGFNRHRFTMN